MMALPSVGVPWSDGARSPHTSQQHDFHTWLHMRVTWGDFHTELAGPHFIPSCEISREQDPETQETFKTFLGNSDWQLC